MEISIQTDKKDKKKGKKGVPPQIDESQYEDFDLSDDAAKQRKIKRLAIINKQLLEKLKQQNDELTKKLKKEKRNSKFRSTSVRTSSYNPKQSQSSKMQLMNAYKQIDMYKSMLGNLKAKKISIEAIDKIHQLENKVKYQEGLIQDLQNEIKHNKNLKNKQEKSLKIVENEEVHESVGELQKQCTGLKQQLKEIKRYIQKRQDANQKQQAYQIELQRAIRKLHDQYYPGLIQKQEEISPKEQQNKSISDKEWEIVRIQLIQLRKVHEENVKKMEQIIKQKNRQLKSAEENELKVKEKSRKLNGLKIKVQEIAKLVRYRQSKKKAEDNDDDLNKNEEKKDLNSTMREAKRWAIPQGYCLEKGKVQPNSIFFSDKNILVETKKTKIIKVNIWANKGSIPNIIQFFYEDEKKRIIDGTQPIKEPSPSLELSVFKIKQEGDYLQKIKGTFLKGEIITLHLISKFGIVMKFDSDFGKKDRESFEFNPKPNEIPSAFFGAYIEKEDEEYRICHFGVELRADW